MAAEKSELTPKQEAFAQAFVQTSNASEAYRLSYDAENMKPESVHRAAKEVFDNPKVAARIAQLRQEMVERNRLTVDDLIRELEEARSAALVGEKPQAAAMVAATMGKAKILGLEAPQKIAQTDSAGNDIPPEAGANAVLAALARKHADT